MLPFEIEYRVERQRRVDEMTAAHKDRLIQEALVSLRSSAGWFTRFACLLLTRGSRPVKLQTAVIRTVPAFGILPGARACADPWGCGEHRNLQVLTSLCLPCPFPAAVPSGVEPPETLKVFPGMDGGRGRERMTQIVRGALDDPRKSAPHRVLPRSPRFLETA